MGIEYGMVSAWFRGEELAKAEGWFPSEARRMLFCRCGSIPRVESALGCWALSAAGLSIFAWGGHVDGR